MIELVNLNQSEPYNFLKKYYDEAIAKNQKIIEAISISSLNKSSMEVESRFVNLKYVINDEWIFSLTIILSRHKIFILMTKYLQ